MAAPWGNGDRIRLFGDPYLAWLGDPPERVGSIPGAVTAVRVERVMDLALVLELDEPLSRAGSEVPYAVLDQEGEAGWFRRTGRVRVELCDFAVERDRRLDRRRGEFAEPTVSYERLNEPEPDEAGPYEELESRWRSEGRLSPTATISGCGSEVAVVRRSSEEGLRRQPIRRPVRMDERPGLSRDCPTSDR